MRRRTVLAVLLLAIAAPAPAAVAAGPQLAFSQSGLEGGGFVNVVAVATNGDGAIVGTPA